MKIIIEIDDKGAGTYQQDDEEPRPCTMTNMSQSTEVKPIHMLGSPAAIEFLRSPNMQVDLSLHVSLPRPEKATPLPEKTAWPPAQTESVWGYRNYCDCGICYEEE